MKLGEITVLYAVNKASLVVCFLMKINTCSMTFHVAQVN